MDEITLQSVKMSDVQEVEQTPENPEMISLKTDMESYRQLLIPINKVLEWEESHYPAILVGLITLLFALIWTMEPSVLTCFSLIGLVICLIDFVVPAVTTYFFATAEWSEVQEEQYEAICQRVLNFKAHIANAKNTLMDLKADKPKAYLLVMMGIFACTAWLGSLMDNLLLTYLMVLFIILLPGLHKHGIIQKMTNSTAIVIKGLIAGKEQVKAKGK